MARQIASYDAAWHPDMHRGVIFLQYKDGGKGRLDAADGGEFAALLGILRHEDAVLTSKGWVGTGLEEPA
jgi:hypothetical protein